MLHNSNLRLLHLVPPPKRGCEVDGECPSRHACYSGECLNPCLIEQPCKANAECHVEDTLPRRTMICTCRQGYKVAQHSGECVRIGETLVPLFSLILIWYSRVFKLLPIKIK